MSELPFFLDTSALLRAYISEPHSSFVLGQMQAASVNVVIRVAYLETYAGLIQRQHRDHRERLKPAQVATLLADFERDWETLAVVELGAEVMDRSSHLIRSHAQAGLRALDAIHLACALKAQDTWENLRVLTFDQRQAAVARALGLNVLSLPPDPV
ncbi:type II toxin-antitoxin system VapC family toxin [Deinococcus aestuarii]|uniref:type II toxin-antitoxin system VapC family toxin n=1 Tax=Deinococcus aestuarii TaxID=2774531 RepID=UPI001C0C212F